MSASSDSTRTAPPPTSTGSDRSRTAGYAPTPGTSGTSGDQVEEPSRRFEREQRRVSKCPLVPNEREPGVYVAGVRVEGAEGRDEAPAVRLGRRVAHVEVRRDVARAVEDGRHPAHDDDLGAGLGKSVEEGRRHRGAGRGGTEGRDEVERALVAGEPLRRGQPEVRAEDRKVGPPTPRRGRGRPAGRRPVLESSEGRSSPEYGGGAAARFAEAPSRDRPPPPDLPSYARTRHLRRGRRRRRPRRRRGRPRRRPPRRPDAPRLDVARRARRHVVQPGRGRGGEGPDRPRDRRARRAHGPRRRPDRAPIPDAQPEQGAGRLEPARPERPPGTTRRPSATSSRRRRACSSARTWSSTS